MQIQAPKGTKDVLPGESYKWQYIEKEMRDLCRLYGINELRTPIIEHTELFMRGVGDTTDIVQKEMYTFKDKGDRSITLKPAGVLSATEDGRGKTVLDLLAPEYRRIGLFPVGRLDKDTEGLLLLTDDGALAHDLLAPKKHVDKVYFARTDGALDDADCKAFEQGITLGDGLECLPAKLEILKSDAQSEALITIREGKFHQIKRMLASRGKPVVYLKRLSMGSLTLDEGLSKGEYRLLTAQEIAALRGK